MWTVWGGGGLRCRSLNPFSNHDSSSSRGLKSKISMEVVQVITWWSKEARSKKGQHSSKLWGKSLRQRGLFKSFLNVVKTDSQFPTKVYSPDSLCGGQNQKELVVSKTPALNNIHQSEKKNRICSNRNKSYLPTHLTHLQRSNGKAKILLGSRIRHNTGPSWSSWWWSDLSVAAIIGNYSTINYIMSGQASL